MNTIECSTRSDSAIGRDLSNLTARTFIFKGFQLASVEGFLQSLKTKEDTDAAFLRSLFGVKAWKEGQQYNNWKETQKLYFNGISYARDSMEYSKLIADMYDAVFDQSPAFRESLRASCHALLDHNGFYNTTMSVLTVPEYICNLYRLRSRLHN